MIVLASLIAIGAATNTWLNRQLLDTDNWVEVSDDLLTNDEVRGALSVYLVNELFTYVDVSGQLDDTLPDQLQVLAGPISAALRQPAIEAVDRVLASPQVQEVWREANRVAHTALVAILKDDTRESVSAADGVVTLNLATVVTNLGEQLGLPQSVLDRIPADAGVITIADSAAAGRRPGRRERGREAERRVAARGDRAVRRRGVHRQRSSRRHSQCRHRHRRDRGRDHDRPPVRGGLPRREHQDGDRRHTAGRAAVVRPTTCTPAPPRCGRTCPPRRWSPRRRS